MNPHRASLAAFALWLAASAWASAEPAPDSEHRLHLGDQPYTLRERVREGPNPLLFFAPHDNESVCVTVAEAYLERNGGRLLELKSPGDGGKPERNLSFEIQGGTPPTEFSVTVDPNRIFTDAGFLKWLVSEDSPNSDELKAAKSVHRGILEAVKAFRNELLGQLRLGDQPLIIGLHNNRPGKTIWMPANAAKRQGKKAGLIHWNHDLDVDDFILTTSDPLFEALKSRDYNVVLEPPDSADDDGSLSIYCNEPDHRIPYVNIEAKQDHPEKRVPDRSLEHARQQAQMLEAVAIFHRNRSLPAAERKRIPRAQP